MLFYSVLEAFGGNFKIVGPGASTEKWHVPHFPDDRLYSRNAPILATTSPSHSIGDPRMAKRDVLVAPNDVPRC